MTTTSHRKFLGRMACALVIAGSLPCGPALAEGSGPPASEPPASAPQMPNLAQKAARRFPQPVRVGDLYDRVVIEPSQHQGRLGRAEGVVRSPDGTLELVVRYGGVLGFGSRLIAVPVDAATLVGKLVQIDDIDVPHLGKLPTFDPAGTTPLQATDMIRVGLDRN